MYVVRSLLSEQRLRYQTVIITDDGPETKTFEREGPTNLITTTTKLAIESETETRLFSGQMNDTSDQTRLILQAQARWRQAATLAAMDLSEWHALHDWLLAAERRAVVPFAPTLADLIPPVAVRMRRDFAALLGLIQTHAILHQRTRDLDEQGRVIATIEEDYRAVHALVADLLSEGVEMTIPPRIRETVRAVDELYRLPMSG